MHCQLEKSKHPAADVSIVQTSQTLHASGEIEAKFRTTQGFESGALDEVDSLESPKKAQNKKDHATVPLSLYIHLQRLYQSNFYTLYNLSRELSSNLPESKRHSQRRRHGVLVLRP
jgi:hypothetical protein